MLIVQSVCAINTEIDLYSNVITTHIYRNRSPLARLSRQIDCSIDNRFFSFQTFARFPK